MEDYKIEQQQALYDTYRTFQEKCPYSFVLLNALHASENDHTRILIALLKYPGKIKKIDGVEEREYPLLRSFLEHIVLKSWKNEADKKTFIDGICSEFQGIPFNQQFIDAQIGDKERRIIIENKICNAGDQDRQLERYANTVLREGISPKNIWLLYLTATGEKTPSPSSLTREVMSKLNIFVDKEEREEDREKRIQAHEYVPIESDQPIRFVEASYAHDILPWLQKEVLEQIPYKEVSYFIPGVKQYISFLQDLYFSLPEQENMKDNLMRKIIEIVSEETKTPESNFAELTKEQNKALFNYYEYLKEMTENVENYNRKRLDKFLDRLKEQTKEYFEKKFQKQKKDIQTEENRARWMWFQLGKEQEISNIHFEWNWDETGKALLTNGQIEFLFHVEKEKTEQKKKICNALQDALRQKKQQNATQNTSIDIPKTVGKSAAVLLKKTVYLSTAGNSCNVENALKGLEDDIQFLIEQTSPAKLKEVLK